MKLELLFEEMTPASEVSQGYTFCCDNCGSSVNSRLYTRHLSKCMLRKQRACRAASRQNYAYSPPSRPAPAPLSKPKRSASRAHEDNDIHGSKSGKGGKGAKTALAEPAPPMTRRRSREATTPVVRHSPPSTPFEVDTDDDGGLSDEPRKRSRVEAPFASI
eukprot:TRINITY_DN8747_c0_g1_i1.p1 TRINITY_DN8747_c0_g1~~TRINITY_DN8747_c0_g1_i1.p1  ORF type:complete len:161 (+),score=10.66 TRINITY_DN8747_c0_g1_i1:23-505(+)